jgi:hypothetical protein
MAEKELIPNDTPEIAKLKACKTLSNLMSNYYGILKSKEYKHYSKSYKSELRILYYSKLLYKLLP